MNTQNHGKRPQQCKTDHDAVVLGEKSSRDINPTKEKKVEDSEKAVNFVVPDRLLSDTERQQYEESMNAHQRQLDSLENEKTSFSSSSPSSTSRWTLLHSLIHQTNRLLEQDRLVLFCDELRRNDPSVQRCLPFKSNSFFLPIGYGEWLGRALLGNTTVTHLNLHVHCLVHPTNTTTGNNPENMVIDYGIPSLIRYFETQTSINQVRLKYDDWHLKKDKGLPSKEQISQVIYLLLDALLRTNQSNRTISALECEQWDTTSSAQLCHVLEAIHKSVRNAVLKEIKFHEFTDTDRIMILAAYAKNQVKKKIKMKFKDGYCYRITMYTESDLDCLSGGGGDDDDESISPLVNPVQKKAKVECLNVASDTVQSDYSSLQTESSNIPAVLACQDTLSSTTHVLSNELQMMFDEAPRSDLFQETILDDVLRASNSIWVRHLYIHRCYFDMAQTEYLLEGLRQRNSLPSGFCADKAAITTALGNNPAMIQTLTFHSCSFAEDATTRMLAFLKTPVGLHSSKISPTISQHDAHCAQRDVVLPHLSIYESANYLFQVEAAKSRSIVASILAVQPSVLDIDNSPDGLEAISNVPVSYLPTIGSQIQVFSMLIGCRFLDSFRILANQKRVPLRHLRLKLRMYDDEPLEESMDLDFCKHFCQWLPELLLLHELHIGHLSEYYCLKVSVSTYKKYKGMNDLDKIRSVIDGFRQSIFNAFRQNGSLHYVFIYPGHESETDESTARATPADGMDHSKSLSLSRFVHACCHRNQHLLCLLTNHQLSILPPLNCSTFQADLWERSNHQSEHTATHLYPMLLYAATQIPKMRLSYVMSSVLVQGDSIGL